MINYIQTERINELSKYDTKDAFQKALKLCEEVGEVAEAVLSLKNAPACGYKDISENDLMEEIADVLIVALALKHMINPDVNLNQIIEKKLDKWESLIDEKRY